jgi:prolipoprotein diacylglyceryltransferase
MENKPKLRLGTGGWITLAVLAGFLVAALVYAADAWRDLSGVAMSEAGWIFLILGIVITILVGAGLMALLFYSSRHDYDR